MAGSRTAARSVCATIGAAVTSTSARRMRSARRALGAHPGADRSRDVRRLRRSCASRSTAPSDVPPLRDRLHARRHRHVRGRRAIRVALPHRARHQGRLRDRRRRRSPGARVTWRLRQSDAATGRASRSSRACCRSTSRPTRTASGCSRSRSMRAGHRRGADRRRQRTAPMPERAVRCADETAALERFCERVRDVRSRRADRLEHRRLRPDGAAADRSARAASVRARPRRRRACGCARPKAISAAARRRAGPRSCSTASTCCAAHSCAWTTTRSMPSRARCWAKAKPSRATCATGSPRSCTTTRTICRRSRSMRARTRGSPSQIVAKLNLVPLAFARSALTGMTPDRVAASIASFDFLYLSELEQREIVAPTVRSDDSRVHAAQQGGHVLEPRHGAASTTSGCSTSRACTRASSARSTSIRWRTSRRRSRATISIATPGGAFRREPAILPGMLDELFPRREAAKRAGDEVATHAIKILMNSFYGVLGTPACRFFEPGARERDHRLRARDAALVEALVRGSRLSRALRRHRQPVRAFGTQRSRWRREAEAHELAARLNAELERTIAERWRVESRLELEFEKLYLKLFLPHARGSARGASKRYAGLVRRGRRQRRVRRHGGGAPRLDRAREAGAARALSTPVRRPARRRLPRRRRAASAQRGARRRARLSQEPAQGRRRLHRDDAAPRRRGAQVDAAAGTARQLRDDDGRRRAARQSPASARSRALRGEAGAAGRGTRARDARRSTSIARSATTARPISSNAATRAARPEIRARRSRRRARAARPRASSPSRPPRACRRASGR